MKRCSKCDYEWIPRLRDPKSCPRCRSRYWSFEGYTKCEICTKNFLKINMHHIDGDHHNNKKGNTIFICVDCHCAIHYGIGRKRKGIQGGFAKRNNYGNWRGQKGQLETIRKLNFYRMKLK